MASRFHELLGQLCSEHDQEVSTLRKELSSILERGPGQVAQTGTSDEAGEPAQDNPEKSSERNKRDSTCSIGSVSSSFIQEDRSDSGKKPLNEGPQASLLAPLPNVEPPPPPTPPPELKVSTLSEERATLGAELGASSWCSATSADEGDRGELNPLSSARSSASRASSVSRPSRLSRPDSPHWRVARRSADHGSMLGSPRPTIGSVHSPPELLPGACSSPRASFIAPSPSASIISIGGDADEPTPLPTIRPSSQETSRLLKHRSSLDVYGMSSTPPPRLHHDSLGGDGRTSVASVGGARSGGSIVLHPANSNASVNSVISELDENDGRDRLKSTNKVKQGSLLLVTTEAFSATSSERQKSRRDSYVESSLVELHPTWAELAQDWHLYGDPEVTPKLLTRKSTHNMRQHMRRLQSVKDLFQDFIPHWFPKNFIASPSSRGRLMWDLLGILFLSYDLTSVPLQVFEFQEHDFAKVGRFVTAIFWSLDIVASFLVGYHAKKGLVEMRACKVARHYLTSWFLLDVLLVGVDWAFLLVYSKTSAVRLGKFTRGMRAFRLLRLVKYHVLLADVTMRVRSEYQRTVLSIGKIITFIVFVNHFIACGFYGLHHLDQTGYTWVMKNFDDDKNAAYRYFTSIHWSLTQFTPASMEVVPVNSIERMYTVCVLLFALVTFSSFVSSITTAMTHLRQCNARKIEQDSTLRRYLSEHDITPELTSRVLHYFQDRQQQNRRQVRTKEGDVELFKVLPESIKYELRYEAFMPITITHPLFHHLQTTDMTSLKHICRSAVVEKRLTVHDELFGHGADVTHMLFMTEGVLVYKYPINAFTVSDRIVKGQWACEVALWANTCELFGPFVAESNCELLMLDRTELRFVAEKYPQSSGRVARYAELYIEQVKEVVKRSRWQSVVLNDFDQAQDLSHAAFETPEKRRESSLLILGGIRNSASKGHRRSEGSFRSGDGESSTVSKVRSLTKTTEKRFTGFFDNLFQGLHGSHGHGQDKKVPPSVTLSAPSGERPTSSLSSSSSAADAVAFKKLSFQGDGENTDTGQRPVPNGLEETLSNDSDSSRQKFQERIKTPGGGSAHASARRAALGNGNSVRFSGIDP